MTLRPMQRAAFMVCAATALFCQSCSKPPSTPQAMATNGSSSAATTRTGQDIATILKARGNCGGGVSYLNRNGRWGLKKADQSVLVEPKYEAIICTRSPWVPDNRKQVIWVPDNRKHAWCPLNSSAQTLPAGTCIPVAYPEASPDAYPETLDADPFKSSVLWTRMYLAHTVDPSQPAPKSFGSLRPPPLGPNSQYISPQFASSPSWETFKKLYPERAIKDEVEGSAKVECIASKDGLLTACKVLSEVPAGYGFGAATVRLYQSGVRLKSGTYQPGNRVRIDKHWQLFD